MSRTILCKEETFKLRLKKDKTSEISQVVYSSRKINSSKDPMGGKKTQQLTVHLGKLRKADVAKAK